MYTLFQQKRSKQKYQTSYFQLAHIKLFFMFCFKLNHHALLFCIVFENKYYNIKVFVLPLMTIIIIFRGNMLRVKFSVLAGTKFLKGEFDLAKNEISVQHTSVFHRGGGWFVLPSIGCMYTITNCSVCLKVGLVLQINRSFPICFLSLIEFWLMNSEYNIEIINKFSFSIPI